MVLNGHKNATFSNLTSVSEIAIATLPELDILYSFLLLFSKLLQSQKVPIFCNLKTNEY